MTLIIDGVVSGILDDTGCVRLEQKKLICFRLYVFWHFLTTNH